MTRPEQETCAPQPTQPENDSLFERWLARSADARRRPRAARASSSPPPPIGDRLADSWFK